jgi:large subunit ribosomal protein L30
MSNKENDASNGLACERQECVVAVGRCASKRKGKARRRNRKNMLLASANKRAAYPPLTDQSSLHIEQYRSSIRQPEVQVKQLRALGLGRIGKTKVVPNIPVFSKLIARLKHLVRVK